MPELPEVETVKRAIADAALSHQIVDVMKSGLKMRWAIPESIKETLTDLTIYGVRRRGKYILVDVGRNEVTDTMIIHLGMSGSVRIYPNKSNIEPKKHDHLTIRTKHHESGVTLVLNDPRRFGGVQLIPAKNAEDHPLLTHLGVEPLSDAMNTKMMIEAFQKRGAPIKAALLDQHIIAGIGNIYASEALYRAGISPKRLAKNVSKPNIERLCMAVKSVLEDAIAQGGTSLRDHVQPGGEIGYFVQSLDVYGRSGKPCNKCSTPIKEIKQSGRTSFYCSTCQR